MKISEYDNWDGVRIVDLLREKQLSHVEVLDAAIERIETRNPKVNALVHQSFDRAREEAMASDQQKLSELSARSAESLFLGLPFLLKDLGAEDAGMPSSGGSRFLVDRTMSADSELVRRLKKSGVRILGRTNTPELGIMGITESALWGPCRNPWNFDHTSGGSSGGAGAAVASRMVPIAHATDGGGSIRIPASACALVGLKPTRARTPSGTAAQNWQGFAVEHALTRSVRDSAWILDAVTGPSIGAPYQVRDSQRSYAEEVRLAEELGAKRPLKIAFSSKSLLGKSIHVDCVDAVQHSAKLCEELGHKVEEVHPEFDSGAMARGYLRVVSASIAATIEASERELGRKAKYNDLEPETWFLFHCGRSLRADEYMSVLRELDAQCLKLASFFLDYDLLLTPTLGTPPARIGEFALPWFKRAMIRAVHSVPNRPILLNSLDQMAAEMMEAIPNTQPFNITGQPAMSLPLYWNADGLPIGTQLIAPFGDEATLFRLARQLEIAAPWADRKPDWI